MAQRVIAVSLIVVGWGTLLAGCDQSGSGGHMMGGMMEGGMMRQMSPAPTIKRFRNHSRKKRGCFGITAVNAMHFPALRRAPRRNGPKSWPE